MQKPIKNIQREAICTHEFANDIGYSALINQMWNSLIFEGVRYEPALYFFTFEADQEFLRSYLC